MEVDCVTDENGVGEFLWLKMIECVVVRRCWVCVLVVDY
jgi:hypothetical protein